MAPTTPLFPLHLNETTGEPYLRLPSPHENIIITPPRMEDAAAVLHQMNDFNVYRWLQGPPHPYLPVHASDWLTQIKAGSDEALQKLAEEETHKPIGLCPVRTLREVRSDGSDFLLGDINVDRCGYPDVQDPIERRRLSEQNSQRVAGDPDIVWCIGGEICTIAPVYRDLTLE